MIDKKYIADLVTRAKDRYYNSGTNLKLTRDEQQTLAEQLPKVFALLDRGSVTDAAFDKLEYYFKKAGGKTTVGAPVRPGKTKVELPTRMTSLDKAYPATGKVAAFTKKNLGPYVLSPKLDGVSIALHYVGKRLKYAYNRGNGTIGQDISFLIPYLNVPKKVARDMMVRGEGLMKDTVFDTHWADKFRNARNLASGVFNKKGQHEALKHIDVVCYEILSPRDMPLSKQLDFLEQQGFNVVPHKRVSRISDSVLSSVFKKYKASVPYTLDGLVVYNDKAVPVPSSGDPTYAIAFKEADDSNLAESKVVGVEWNPSKHGYLKPRVQIEPVELAGVTVTYANGFNAYYIEHGYSFKDRAKHGGKKYPIGPGAVIELIRSGEVIPDIQRVVKAVRKPQMPDKSFGPVHWTANEVDLVLDEGHENQEVAVKKIAIFLSQGLGVEHLAAGMVAKLYKYGFTTVKDFLTAEVEDFLEVPGIRETLATKFYDQISSRAAQADMANVAANSGFFGTTIGAKRVQQIIDQTDILKLPYRDEQAVADTVAAIHGFSGVTAQRFAKGLRQFIPWLKTVPVRFKKRAPVKPAGSALANQSVCFTGFRSAELEFRIKEQGGAVSTGVTGKTTILVTNDPDSGTGKAQKARQLGLPIYTPDQFKKKYRL